MIIAIATNRDNLNTLVDPHFGRCRWYCLFNTQTRKSTFIENPASQNNEKRGYDAGEFLIGKGIEMAVAGRFGSNVIDLFRRNNIQMIIPEAHITLTEIINKLKTGSK